MTLSSVIWFQFNRSWRFYYITFFQIYFRMYVPCKNHNFSFVLLSYIVRIYRSIAFRSMWKVLDFTCKNRDVYKLVSLFSLKIDRKQHQDYNYRWSFILLSRCTSFFGQLAIIFSGVTRPIRKITSYKIFWIYNLKKSHWIEIIKNL